MAEVVMMHVDLEVAAAAVAVLIKDQVMAIHVEVKVVLSVEEDTAVEDALPKLSELDEVVVTLESPAARCCSSCPEQGGGRADRPRGLSRLPSLLLPSLPRVAGTHATRTASTTACCAATRASGSARSRRTRGSTRARSPAPTPCSRSWRMAVAAAAVATE